MAPAVNERSPLLSTAASAPRIGPWERLRRARYALIPVLVLAIVAIAYAISTSSRSTSGSSTVPTHASTSSGEDSSGNLVHLLTMAPPYLARAHVLPPKNLHRAAFAGAIPTNAFWTNLLVGDDHGQNVGAGQVTLSPYTVRSLPRRLEISYGDTRRVVTAGNITEYFNADVGILGALPDTTDGPLLGGGSSDFRPELLSTGREVVDFDPLAVTVEYQFRNETSQVAPEQRSAALRLPLVRGAPYITAEYQGLMPILELNATVFAINQVPVVAIREPLAPGKHQQFTARRFELDIGVYGATHGAVVRQKWVVYFADERTLRLQWVNATDVSMYDVRGQLQTPTAFRLIDTDVYDGAMRVAIVPLEGARVGTIATLDKYATSYPVGSAVSTRVSEDGKRAEVQFCWQARALASEKRSNATDIAGPLLMLAHPHHVASFSNDKASTFKVLTSDFGHRTLKSTMTPVVGDCWTLEEELPNVGFTSESHAPIDPVALSEIRTSLVNDSNFTPVAEDPYFFGKEIGRQARLVLIADTIGEIKIRDELLDKLEEWTTPWLLGNNSDPFIYDEAWGGICSKNGLAGVFWMSDFGNGWYNDHHFHYGYFLYSLAVVAKFRPAFAKTHEVAILAITRDIASANMDDEYFPFARHFSWFDGHSFASGVYTLDGGKSQESVSEAINAYYGVYLLGLAMKIPAVEQLGHILVALESRAARTYWQMDSNSTIYEEVYRKNRMTGQVASTKVSYTTWFGPEIEHMHLINMIPFTPITDTFLSPSYVREEYPVLVKEAFERPENPIDARWRGYAYLDLAIIDPASAWRHVQELNFFDDGSSRTNSLFWIATRPQNGTSMGHST